MRPQGLGLAFRLCLIGLVLAPPVVVAGVVDAGAAVRYGLPVTRVLLDVSATIVVGLSILPKLLGFDRPTHTEPVLRLNLEAADSETCARATDEVLALIRGA